MSLNTQSLKCPVCKEAREHLVYELDEFLDSPLKENINEEEPWELTDGICQICLDEANTELLSNLLSTSNQNEGWAVLPTPIRLNVDRRFTGKGVTICFIDSGFTLHPDLINPTNRIKKVFDINYPELNQTHFEQPRGISWHGTMTSVVCAGNGHLSDGLYTGIAKDAELVLIQISNPNGSIPCANIAKAMKWVLDNHQEYDIKIVNLSVSDDEPTSYHLSEIDQLAKALEDAEIHVVAAAGNDPNTSLKPPANSPNVITVGGLDDQNTLDALQRSLYHSTYGITVDGLIKPDLIAPAIWIAAPILIGTTDYEESNRLFALLDQDDIGDLYGEIQQKIREKKFVSPHYKHADGTSFAAPIVCSIIAQLLEVKPNLSPSIVRDILFRTAQKITSEAAIRQGHGVVNALSAVALLTGEHHETLPSSPVLNFYKKTIEFYYHDHHAVQVNVAGDFSGWNTQQYSMDQSNEDPGLWRLSIPMMANGVFRYKFFVNGKVWKQDPLNLYKEPDGYNGFNSLFKI